MARNLRMNQILSFEGKLFGIQKENLMAHRIWVSEFLNIEVRSAKGEQDE